MHHHARLKDGSQLPCGYCELNPGPLQESSMLLTAEPSLRPHHIICFLVVVRHCLTEQLRLVRLLCSQDQPQSQDPSASVFKELGLAVEVCTTMPSINYILYYKRDLFIHLFIFPVMGVCAWLSHVCLWEGGGFILVFQTHCVPVQSKLASNQKFSCLPEYWDFRYMLPPSVELEQYQRRPWAGDTAQWQSPCVACITRWAQSLALQEKKIQNKEDLEEWQAFQEELQVSSAMGYFLVPKVKRGHH